MSPYGYDDGLETWDLSDLANPVRLSRFKDCNGHAIFLDFAVGGGYAYMAGLQSGLIVFDLAGTGTVTPINTFPSPEGQGQLERVLLSGDTLLGYGSSWEDAAISVCDVHVPGKPLLLGTKRSPVLTGITRWFYSAPYLVTVYGNPTNPGDGFAGPTQVGVFYWPDLSDVSTFVLTPVNAAVPFLTGETIHEAAMEGPRLFLATDSGARVVDLSNPAVPMLSTTFDDSTFHAYNTCYGIAAAEGVYIVADRAGVTAFDLNGERTGHVISESAVAAGWMGYKPLSLTTDGSVGLLNSRADGVAVCSFGDGPPVRLGFWENVTGGDQGYLADAQISADGRYGYVATADFSASPPRRGAVVLLDLSDPTQPNAIGSYVDQDSTGEWFPIDLEWIAPNTIAATLAEARTAAYRVDLLDLSNPTKPFLLGTYSAPAGTEINGVTPIPGTFGGRTYLALACGWTPGENARVQVVDITDPSFPFLTVDLDTGVYGYSTDIFGMEGEAGPSLVVAALANALAIDVTDPSTPSGLRVNCPVNPNGVPFQVASPIPWAGPEPQVVLGSGDSSRNPTVRGDAEVYRLTSSGCVAWTAPVHSLWGFPRWAGGAPADRKERVFQAEDVAGVMTYRPQLDFSCPYIDGDISPQFVTVSAPVTLTVDGVHAPNGVKEVAFSYEWDCQTFTGGIAQPAGPDAYSFTFDPAIVPRSGTYGVYLQVEDSLGLKATAGFGGYTVIKGDPLAAQGQASSESGYTPLEVSLQGAASGGFPPYSYRWDFSDGTWAFGATVTHTFTTIGYGSWTLTVGDAVEDTVQTYGAIQVLDPRVYPGIDQVQPLGSPFRLKIIGGNFRSGCEVLIDGTQAPLVKFVSDTQLMVKKGQPLKNMVPKGKEVSIIVRNPDGAESQGFVFLR